MVPPTRVEDEIERLREAVDARDAFLAAVAHELRTPIGAMLLHVDGARMLAANAGSEALATRLDALGRQMLQFSRRATTLLDVSVLAAGKLRLHSEPGVDVVDVVRNAIELLTPDAMLAGSNVTMDNQGAVIGTFDRTRLEQIVLNLVGNAVKYGAGKPVVVKVAQEGDVVSLTVRDGGIGISQDDQARIFQRFERVQSGRQPVSGETPKSGVGVGLWIVYQIVEVMGGTIKVESSLGRGATFEVVLPAQRSS
ncbi:MAG: HAMP domain-containing histidine kinase [Clostridia bacterium]|nr:HAMP domain-containing histidine kinase [Deltaproteobacteria bacterium]